MYIVVVKIGVSDKHYHYLSPVPITPSTKVLIDLGGHDKVVPVIECFSSEDTTPYPIEQMKYISGILARPDQSPPNDISLDDLLLKLGFTKHDNETTYFDSDENTEPATVYFSSELNQGFTFKSIDKIAPTLANYFYRMGYRDCEKEIS